MPWNPLGTRNQWYGSCKKWLSISIDGPDQSWTQKKYNQKVFLPNLFWCRTIDVIDVIHFFQVRDRSHQAGSIRSYQSITAKWLSWCQKYGNCFPLPKHACRCQSAKLKETSCKSLAQMVIIENTWSKVVLPPKNTFSYCLYTSLVCSCEREIFFIMLHFTCTRIHLLFQWF